MVTSGSVSGTHVSDGNDNSYLDWQVASQDTVNNKTTINWQVGWHFVGYSCRGLRLGSGVINGVTVYHDTDSGDGVHSYNAAHDHRPGTGKLQTASGTAVITHNSDGTKTFSASVGMTGYSGQVSNGTASFALPTIPRSPGAPTTPVISDIKQTSVVVSWTPNASDGLPVTSYTIGYGTDSSAPTTTTTSTTSPKTITGLDPATKYYFWVKATNSAGTGPYSASSNAETIAGARVNVGGTWVKAIPYVRVGGVWKLATPWVKTLGVWKETI